MGIQGSNYVQSDANYFGVDGEMITLSHIATQDRLSFANVAGEYEVVEVFERFLQDTRLNERNTFFYVPSPLSKRAVIVEFGVRDQAGFNQPRFTMLCRGVMRFPIRGEELCYRENSSTQSTEKRWIPLKETGLFKDTEFGSTLEQILAANSMEDLSPALQNELLSKVSTLPVELQYRIGLDPSALLPIAKEVFRREFGDLEKLVEVKEARELSYSMKQDSLPVPCFKPESAENLEGDYHAFAYKRIITTAPKQEEVRQEDEEARFMAKVEDLCQEKIASGPISEGAMEAMKRMLNEQIEQLKISIL